jgi:fumarate reductase flavoprotein subunit
MKRFLKVPAVWVVCAACVVLALGACENQTGNQTGSGYIPGEYTGTGKGRQPLTIKLTFSETEILSATVGVHTESINDSDWNAAGAAAVRQALVEIPPAIVENQGTTGVDIVTGATMTSNGLIEAANNCIKQAKGGK